MTTTLRTVNPRAHQRFSIARPRKSVALTVIMLLFLIYAIVPLAWLVINASKTQADLFTTFGLAFGDTFALWDNIVATFTYDDGIFLRWLGNTLLYVVLGAGGATLLATLAGYGLAKYTFPGRTAYFAVVLGAVAVPGTALAVPTFLLFSQMGLTNTPWSIIIPSLITPFGLYLIWVYTIDSVPTELLEAARLDGASEMRTFFTISIRLLTPGIVTVALFSIVATWNNYFLPLIMLSDPTWYPLTVGLNQWSSQASGVAAEPIYNLVITGSLITIVPIVVIFLFLQRFWQSGLSAGSVKQ
ncbi:carbohydrate ABC transporter permease [Microbacterium terricola]|uniref:Sugar ABC transporter permease n=1 Tax=Microbacterium terricola TaxID=344163 RepID=A0ABM8E2U9_9MICO|nr:carbohydrate ABC transporter permease [Microbacterium terricola]UYK40013.1 carbohydrate ABC transporter permease [Microbacterium terricola]BDV32297.1 sugar ABC transporter permease [Microbacterium terricola]